MAKTTLHFTKYSLFISFLSTDFSQNPVQFICGISGARNVEFYGIPVN